MISQDELLAVLKKKYSANNSENYTDVTLHPTEGVVVDTDDPLQQGRLRVFCPAYGDNPEKIHLLPWATYVSPFGGVINSQNFERNGETTEGAVAYGLWAVPDLGANVVVNCFDGDLRRRFWSGCIIDPQQAHTILGGRFEYGKGKVEGPLSSNSKPIQPLYDNQRQAFSDQTGSPEYQTRAGGYTAAAVDKTNGQEPNPSDNIHLDQQYTDIAGAQSFSFNKSKVGGHGYDNSGFVNVPMKASRVFGFSSPGFHSLTMDDRPFNNSTKLRSSSGHVIILDDTNERIYIATNGGANYVEMDSSGNIDVYSQRRVSIHSDSDINLDAGGSIRMTAATGIYGYAGGGNGLATLSSNPTAGEIRFQSQNDMHIISENYRQLSFSDTIFEIGGKRCESVGDDYFLQVQKDMNIITNDGDYNLTVSGDYNLEILKQMDVFAISGIKMGARGDIEFYSYYGNLSLAAQQDLQFKSISGDIQMEAVGGNSGGSGGIKIKTNDSQISIDKSGTNISTNGSVNIQSGGNMNLATNSPVPQDQPFPDASQVPAPDPTCGNLPATIPIAGFSGADLAARVAWNAGFRGQGLTIIVAIAGAESSFNPNAIGDVSLQTAKWGPSCGFWQIRSLVDPSAYGAPDNLRVKDKLLTDAQYNANAAFAFSKSGTKFSAWSTYTSGDYLWAKNMTAATDAIKKLCASGTQNASYDPDRMSVSDISSREPEILGLGLGKSSIQISPLGINLQSLQDVGVNSLSKGFSTNVISGMVAQIDSLSLELNTLAYYSSLAMTAIGIITGHGINFPVNAQAIINLIPIPSEYTAILGMISTGMNINIDALKSNFIQYLKGEAQTVFNFENFDLNGKTIL